MLKLHTAYDVQIELRDFLRASRRRQKLSVAALSERSGVPYGTIRRFEDSGHISLRQFLMLYEALLGVSDLLSLARQRQQEPGSIEEVLKDA